MPIYEYECRHGHRFERYIVNPHSYTPRCPVCNTGGLKQVFSRTAPPILKEGKGGFHKPTKP